jgi:hypothetical protein
MTIKKKVWREPLPLQRIFDLFGLEETQEVEVQPMTNREFYFFFVSATTAMFILSFLIKIFIV